MTTVAMAFGQPFIAVWRAPYHETLFALCGVVQRRRIESLETWARGVTDAFRINAAFANPKALETERQELRAALRLPHGVKPPAMTKDDAAKMAAQILVDAKMVPAPEATRGD